MTDWHDLLIEARWIPLIAPAAAVAIVVLIMMSVFASLRLLAPGCASIRPVEPGDRLADFQAANRVRARIEPLGFEWHGALLLTTDQPNFIGVWRHVDESSRRRAMHATWFILKRTGRRMTCEFVSRFDYDGPVARLTTANSSRSLLLPTPPGMPVQSFPRMSIEELWRRHDAAARALGAHFHLRPAEPIEQIDEWILHSSAEQYEYVRSLRFWPLRSVWWWLGRRHLRANRPAQLPSTVRSAEAASLVDRPAVAAT